MNGEELLYLYGNVHATTDDFQDSETRVRPLEMK